MEENLVMESTVDKTKEYKKWFNNLGFRYVAATAILLAVQLIGIGIFSVACKDGELAEKLSMYATMLPMYVIGTPLIYLVMKGMEAKKIEKQSYSFGKCCLTYMVCIAVMQIGNLIGTLLNVILAAIVKTEAVNPIADMLTGNTIVANLIIVSICAPIVEELIFRKWLIDRTAKFGDKVSILVSGLAFGLFHGNITQFVYASCLGFVLAYVYLRSGDIKKCIGLHMAVNFTSSVVGMLVINNSHYLEYAEKIAEVQNDLEAVTALTEEYMGGIMMYFAYLFVIFSIVIAGIVIFFVNKKKLVINEGTEVIEKGKAGKIIVGNPGVIIYMVIWIIMMIFTILSPILQAYLSNHS